jgi:hypothetical protein
MSSPAPPGGACVVWGVIRNERGGEEINGRERREKNEREMR